MTKTQSALILLNGELSDARAVRAAARRSDALICADGGARHAAALRLRPDAIVGDMDSLPRPLPSSWAAVTRRRDADPNRSDLDKALDAARTLGASRLYIAGALGGGLDHALVNFAALESSVGTFEVTVVDRGTARLLGPGRHRLTIKRGGRFSLLAAPLARLDLSGARYGLKNAILRRGSRGLGNQASGPVVLRVHRGRVWVIDAVPFRG